MYINVVVEILCYLIFMFGEVGCIIKWKYLFFKEIEVKSKLMFILYVGKYFISFYVFFLMVYEGVVVVFCGSIFFLLEGF